MSASIAFLTLAFLALVAGAAMIYIPAGLILARILFAAIGFGLVEDRDGGRR